MLYLTTQKKFDKEMNTNYSNAVYSQWHNGITHEEKRKVAQFFENWLLRADDRILTDALTKRLIVETLTFFNNPEELMRHCDTSQFFSQHESDGVVYYYVSHLIGKLFEHNLDGCVSIIFSNPKVHDILHQDVSRASEFFNPLTQKKRFSMATEFFDQVQDKFSPNMLFKILASIILNKNYTLAKNLNQRPQFQNFITTFGFDHYSILSLHYLPAVHPKVIQQLPFSEKLKLHIGLSIVQRNLQADNFNNKNWEIWLDQQNFDRVDFVRHTLSAHFEENKEKYLSGSPHVDPEYYDKMVKPALNLLKPNDIAYWRANPWRMDTYYRVSEHTGFVKCALMEHVDVNTNMERNSRCI